MEHLLAYISGSVDQELLLRNEYVAAENRILRAKIKCRLQLSDGEKSTLAEIAHRLGRKALAEVAVAAQPETILGWFRKLVARKFDGSRFRDSVGRPCIEEAVENLIVRMAQENPTWGYDRIVGGARESRPYGVGPNGGQCFAAPWHRAGSPAQAYDPLARFHSGPHGCPGRHRLLHGRSAHAERADHLLRAVLHSARDAAGVPGGDNAISRPAVNGATSPQRDHEGLGVFGPKPLPPT